MSLKSNLSETVCNLFTYLNIYASIKLKQKLKQDVSSILVTGGRVLDSFRNGLFVNSVACEFSVHITGGNVRCDGMRIWSRIRIGF